MKMLQAETKLPTVPRMSRTAKAVLTTHSSTSKWQLVRFLTLVPTLRATPKLKIDVEATMGPSLLTMWHQYTTAFQKWTSTGHLRHYPKWPINPPSLSPKPQSGDWLLRSIGALGSWPLCHSHVFYERPLRKRPPFLDYARKLSL